MALRKIVKESVKQDLWNYKEQKVLEGIYLWSEYIYYENGFHISYVKENGTGKMLGLYSDKHKLQALQKLPENTAVKITYLGQIRFEGQPETFSPMDNFEIEADVPDGFDLAKA